LSSFAQTGVGPKLVCETPVHEFGNACNEQDVEHVFSLRNEGSAPLAISKVAGCCGASTQLAQNNVPPGTGTTLRVTLSLRGRSGPVWKSFYVQSNDPFNPVYQLQFRGNAVAVVDVQPSTLDFGAIAEDSATNGAISIVCQSNASFHVTNIVSAGACFAVRYIGREGATHRISISTIPPLPGGLLKADVRLLTDSPRYPTIELHAQARVSSDIVVVPDEILVAGKADKPTPLTRYLAVRSRSKTPFKVLSAVAPSSDMTVTTTRTADSYRLEIGNILPFDELNGEKVVITTDHRNAKQIAIPFRVVQTPKAGKR